MKYSLFTVMTPAWTPDQTAAKLKEFGYNGVEWRVQKAAPATAPDPMPARNQLYWQYNQATLEVDDIANEAAKSAAICDQYGLEKLSLASYLTPSQLEKIDALLCAAQANGYRMIRLFPDNYNAESNYRVQFSQVRASMFEVERLCRKYGVEANLEIHMNTIMPSASAAYRLIEGMDPELIGVVFDAGNMVYEGYEQYKFGMELLDKHVHHVHIKDSTWAPDKDGILAPTFAPIGTGCVKFDKLFAALKSIGYDRYLSFEDFSCDKSDDEKLAQNLAYIKEKFENA